VRRRVMLSGALAAIAAATGCMPSAASRTRSRPPSEPASAPRSSVTPVEPVQPKPRPAGADLAVPPTGNVAERIAQHDDGSAPPGTPAPRPTVSFAFQRDGFRLNELSGKAMPYTLRQAVVLDDSMPQTADGVRLYEIAGRLYEHPNFQAGHGLNCLETYRLNGRRHYLELALRHGEHLVEHRVESRGAWFFQYTFDFRVHANPNETMRAPWYSGLAQGKVLSFFSRLYEITGERRWLEAARRTFASFLNLPSKSAPWVTRVDQHNLLWLVEYPYVGDPSRSDHVFNGHMSALFGLWDYYRVARADAAMALFDGSVTTMRRYLSVMRVPRRPSMYCVPHGFLATGSYHSLHISQFVHLWLMTGATEFIAMADALRDDYPPVELPEPRAVKLQAGRHAGYAFDISTGQVLDRTEVTLSHPSTAMTRRRLRFGDRGIFYRLDDGPLAGWWVVENKRAMLRGPVAEVQYKGFRAAILRRGRTYRGRAYDANGRLLGTNDVVTSRDTTVWLDKSAWIDGAPASHLATGELAGYWVRTKELTLP